MAIPICLALTAAELAGMQDTPSPMGWLACHFSPYSQGLSNMPPPLQPDSVLILDDSNPFTVHQGTLIVEQLLEYQKTCPIKALVLDFQYQNDRNLRILADLLRAKLPYPVIAPPEYAGADSPVLLPPCPLQLPLAEHIAPYQNRQIWLEIALNGLNVTVTSSGCIQEPFEYGRDGAYPHWDPRLLCHYKISKTPESITFQMQRTRSGLTRLMTEAEDLGVCHAIGLWQELK